MTDSELVRRLTTIMDIDVVGFSTMSARNEEHALALLSARMTTAQATIRQHRGRVFKLTGDGLLAEFASPVEAVRAALEIQEAMRAANDPAAAEDQMVLRIGVNLGDVVESGDDLMGDAVNVAARLESIARPGGICVSSAVYEQIQGKLTLGAEDMGEQRVKNIPRAIHAYQLSLDGVPLASAPPAPAQHRPAAMARLGLLLGGGAVVALLALGGAWWVHRSSSPVASAPAVHAPPSARSAATSPTTPGATAPAAPAAPNAPAATAAPAPAAVAEAAAQPPDSPAVAAMPPPQPPAEAPPRRRFVVEEVPFVSEFRWRRLEEYGKAEGAKAFALNVRGWFGFAVRRLDVEVARRVALEECNATVEREVPIRRPYDRCTIYAEGDDVVWPFHRPPLPPAPHRSANPPAPPIPFDAAAVPLVTEPARRNLADHYASSPKRRALVLGPNRIDWWTPSETEADAVRRTLQICGHLAGRPCTVYAVDDRVVVRVPTRHKVTDIFTPQEIERLDSSNRGIVERYLIADDWRAIAMDSKGWLGIVSGRASEAEAVDGALEACRNGGGSGCRLLAIGPFVVDPG